MRAVRLARAIADGLFVLPPEGPIAVYGPLAEDDLGALPARRVQVIATFRPDHDAFAARGFAVGAAPPHAAAVVCLPRSHAAALARLARAMTEAAPGAPILVDGQKTDGIAPVLRALEGAGLAPGEVLSKAHGKAFVFAAAAHPDGWVARMSPVADGFVTQAGVFSEDGPDAGSQLLAAALPGRLLPRMADFGAGWGYLSRAVLAREGVQSLDLLEAEALALDCARINLTDPRVRFHWADATRAEKKAQWDGIVMNPPFHAGRAADPGLGQSFIRAAHRGLAPGGKLWMVANRHLPYEPLLKSLFAEVEEIGGNRSFRLTEARRPLLPGRQPAAPRR